MSTVESILAEASRLPVADRLRLIEALWETVPEELAMTLSPEWMAEIERRSAEFDAGRMEGVPWEEVQAAALKRLPQMERQREE